MSAADDVLVMNPRYPSADTAAASASAGVSQLSAPSLPGLPLRAARRSHRLDDREQREEACQSRTTPLKEHRKPAKRGVQISKNGRDANDAADGVERDEERRQQPRGCFSCYLLLPAKRPKDVSKASSHGVAKSSTELTPPQSSPAVSQITSKLASPITINSASPMTHKFPSSSTDGPFSKHPTPAPSPLPPHSELPSCTKTTQTQTDSELTQRKVVWKEGLLQRLGRLHGLGNCKLSLEELIELDDNACLHDLERLQEAPPPPPPPSSSSRTSNNMVAPPPPPSSSMRISNDMVASSAWRMEFEGGGPILHLRKEDLSPQLVNCVWPFSQTNCLFEASRRHYGNYKYAECR